MLARRRQTILQLHGIGDKSLDKKYAARGSDKSGDDGSFNLIGSPSPVDDKDGAILLSGDSCVPMSKLQKSSQVNRVYMNDMMRISKN